MSCDTDPCISYNRHGILAIGNLLVDKTHNVSAYPPESMLALISQSTSSPGGGVVNVLFDLAKIDPELPLTAAGLVGKDEDGAFLVSEFERHGIDASRIVSVDGSSTSFTHVVISKSNATRTFFHSPGANARLGIEDFRLIDSKARIAHLAYLLLLQGLDRPNDNYGSGGAEALYILQRKGFKTSLDLVSEDDCTRYESFVLPALRYTDYLIINDVEAANLTGTPVVTGKQYVNWDAALKQADGLIERGVNELVAIHFPQGAVAVSRTGEHLVQPSYLVPKANVVSTLGAGDAFCAGVLYGIHEMYALADCLKLGIASAHCNLFAASATDGAVPLSSLLHIIAQN